MVIRIVGLAAAHSHITGLVVTIRRLCSLCAIVGPDLEVVATGSGGNDAKVRKASLATGRKP
jgi:hypothetical protein